MKTDLTANTGAALFWFRRDLRLTDNPGLLAAIATGRPLICVSIDDISLSASDDGAGNVDRWRAASVDSLAEDIAARGGGLVGLVVGDFLYGVDGIRFAHSSLGPAHRRLHRKVDSVF